MFFVMQNISPFASFVLFREQNVVFLKSEFSSFSQSICYELIISWPILLKFLLQPPLVFSSAHQEWCCPRNNFSASKKFFSLNTPNFGKIVVIPFLKVFGMNLAVFMPQTFRKKSGTLLLNHKTNSSFHSLKDEAYQSSIYD